MELRGLKIGIVGPVPPPFGGMANQTRQLAGLLEAEGARVSLVPVNAPYRPAWIGRLRGARAVFRLLPYLSALWRLAGRVELIHVMANSGWSWHLFAAPAIWIGWFRQVPVVVNYRGGEADTFFQRSFTWVRPSLRRAAAVVVPSGFLEEVFRRRGVSTHIVPNIIDLQRFTQKRRPEGSGEPVKTVLVPRNLEPIYDVATALRAFAQVYRSLPEARLVIAGAGPERAALEGLAAGLGIGQVVTFSGRVDNERMAALYQTADVMLTSSLADNMPISILEALASGVPVVSTRVGGVPYLVEDGKTALLVPPGDETVMAAAVLKILTDADLAGRLAAAGMKQVQGYAWPNVRDRLVGVYRRVLDARAPRLGHG